MAWTLPQTMEVGGKIYQINTDYRDILEIIDHLNNPDQPEIVRWQVAVALFYEGDLPKDCLQEAMEKMASFIGENEQTDNRPHPKLLDWEQDALPIVADINKVAGTEIRALSYLHWWTFLSYFRGIGEGQLATIVSIRSKLANRKNLEKWEQDFYRDHKAQVDLKKKCSSDELAQKERILKMIGG